MAGTPHGEQGANRRRLQRASDNLAQVLGGIGVGGKSGLADVGVEVVNEVRRLLSQRGSGRVYYRRGPGRGARHQASSPGRPPAVDTGQLRASYHWQTGDDAQGPYVDIGTNDKKARHLEMGTRRMRPRPHLRPALNRVQGRITQLVAQGIVREQTAVVRRLPSLEE